jgi:hypothetical protein
VAMEMHLGVPKCLFRALRRSRLTVWKGIVCVVSIKTLGRPIVATRTFTVPEVVRHALLMEPESAERLRTQEKGCWRFATRNAACPTWRARCGTI